MGIKYKQNQIKSLQDDYTKNGLGNQIWSEFAKKHGVSTTTAWRWTEQLRKEKKETESAKSNENKINRVHDFYVIQEALDLLPEIVKHKQANWLNNLKEKGWK